METDKLAPYQRNYQFTDISGQFILNFESGVNQRTNAGGGGEYYVKKRLIGEKDNQEYERLIAVSTLGSLSLSSSPRPAPRRRMVHLLRPKISQYTVWFKKEKYFSQLEVLPDKKMLKVKMISPEKKWNGEKLIPFRNSRGLFCFFSQIPDCVKKTGFLSKAIKQKSGKMSFTIIWDGYPFIGEQYSGIHGPFSTAIFSYERPSKEGDWIFHLNFGEQVIFYHFNTSMQLEKKFWVSQGLRQEGI